MYVISKNVIVFLIMKTSVTARYLFALMLYGTIGFFLHFVKYSSEFVVLARGVLGSLFIYIVLKAQGRQINKEAIKNNFWTLVISGFGLGFNWVFLFMGYRHGIAISSLCNYMAPIITVVILAYLNKQKMSLRQIFLILMAFIGMMLLTGVFSSSVEVDPYCVIYGLLAALGFVVIILCNKRLVDIDPLEKTLVQLLSSAVIVFPYVCFTKGFPTYFDLTSVIIILILGFVHTGVAYIFYFSSIDVLPAETIAILGYLEPVLNFIIGAAVFHEPLGFTSVIGAFLIILASVLNETGEQ